MHDTKEHINYGKSHIEKSGRKYSKIWTTIPMEVHFLAGCGFLYVFLYIVVTNTRPQFQMCKKCKFIFIFYTLILMASPTLWWKLFSHFRGIWSAQSICQEPMASLCNLEKVPLQANGAAHVVWWWNTNKTLVSTCFLGWVQRTTCSPTYGGPGCS